MLTAIVVAAGQSRRMLGHGDKILLPLLGHPLIVHTLAPFCRSALVDEIILVVKADLVGQLQLVVADHGLGKVAKVIAGGETRQASVNLGLAQLEPECDFVAIHDGARPCLRDEQLADVIGTAKSHGAAILAVPVKDTVKRVRSGVEIATPDRSELFLAQTPQVFCRQWVVAAYRLAGQAGRTATDDAALVTAAGHAVRIVSGDYRNIKVTTPDDLPLAELILSGR